METMTKLPTMFDRKFEKAATLVAYLIGGIVYKDDGKIHIASRSELNEIISMKYEQKDFIGANEILEAARETFKELTIEEQAERVSKSFRVSTATYLRLVKYASKNNISLSDYIVSALLVPAMRKRLDDISDNPQVSSERLELLYGLLDDWSAITSEAPFDTYEPDLYYWKTDKPFKELTESYIRDKCEREGIPEKVADRCISYLDFKAEDNAPNIIISFDKENETLKIEISTLIIFGLNCDYYGFQKEIDADFGSEIRTKLFDAFFDYYDIEDLGENELLALGFNLDASGSFSVNGENRIYFNGIEISEENKRALDALIYEQIAHEKYEDIEVYAEKVKEASEKEDYEFASELSKKLAMKQVKMEISEWLRDILFSFTETPQLVIFTIPPILLGLLELTSGDKTISDLLDELIGMA